MPKPAKLKIIFQDEFIVVFVKPSRLMVHPTSRGAPKCADRSRSWTALSLIRNQIQKKVFPVHRLDRATSGLMMFALSSDVAKNIQIQFSSRQVYKEYFALVRGWPATEFFDVTKDEPVFEKTHFQVIKKFELPFSVQEKFSTSRYALVRCIPETGRRHQIRRHLKSARHPIIGDTIYGDGKQSRAFQNFVQLKGLYLRSKKLALPHPTTGISLAFEAEWSPFWAQTFDCLNPFTFV